MIAQSLFEFRRWIYTAIACVIIYCTAGCGTVKRITSGPDVHLKAVASMGFAVDRAMDAAGRLYRAGVIDEDARQRLSKLHQKWQPIWASAYKAVRDDRTIAPPAELKDATDAILDAARGEGVVTP